VQRALALTLAATISAAKVWRKSSSYTYDKCKEALEAAGLREPALTAADAGVQPSARPRSSSRALPHVESTWEVVRARTRGAPKAAHRHRGRMEKERKGSRRRLDPAPKERLVTLRRQLGVVSFEINQIVLQPGQRGRIHRDRRQDVVHLVLERTAHGGHSGPAPDLGLCPSLPLAAASGGREARASAQPPERGDLTTYRLREHLGLLLVAQSDGEPTTGSHARWSAGAQARDSALGAQPAAMPRDIRW
jgi:hypothetical protein